MVALREIETAISEKRNIIPLFFDGFDFGNPSISEKLTGKLGSIKKYNGLNVPADYFDPAMEKLCRRYLKCSLDAVILPISSEEIQKVIDEQKVAANNAIELQKEAARQKAEELSKRLYAAIKYEKAGDLQSALKMYYEIQNIDPLYPSIETKINELKNEILIQNQDEEKARLEEKKTRKERSRGSPSS